MDENGTVWTLVNGQAARDGTIDGVTNSIILLLYYNGLIYQETSHTLNGVNLWWYWNGSSWISTPNPISAFSSMLKAEVSGLCVNVVNASLAPDAGLEQYDCNGYISLVFSFKPANGIYYTVISANSNLCLDYGSSSSAGNQVIQNNCVSGQQSQLWTISPASDGSYSVVTSDGKGCLGISGGSTASKAIVVTSPCNGSTAQRFRTPLSSVSGGTTYSTTMTPIIDSLCINVVNASTTAGTGIEQYSCTGGASEQFSLTPVGEGLYTVVSANSGLCLDFGSSSTAGTQVVQNTCSPGASSQEWMVEANADGSYTLGASDGQGCMEVQGSSSVSKTIVETSACSSGSPGQRYTAPGL